MPRNKMADRLADIIVRLDKRIGTSRVSLQEIDEVLKESKAHLKSLDEHFTLIRLAN